MVNKFFPATFAFALLLAQVAHALHPRSCLSDSDASPTPMTSSVASTSPTTSSVASTSPTTSSVASTSPTTSSVASTPPTTSTPMTTTSAPPQAPAPYPLYAVFDPTYDNSNGQMDTLVCSNGDNGLDTKFPTFSDVPSFPFIGGAYDVVWDSPNCGSCWSITNPATGLSIQMTAIDISGFGFTLSEQAFAYLTYNNLDMGVIDVVANKLSTTPCGL